MRIFNYEIEFQSSTPDIDSIYLNFEFFFESTTKELMKINMVCLTSRSDRIEYGVHRFNDIIAFDCDQLKQTVSSLHINEADQRIIMDEFMNQFNEFNLIFPGEQK